MPWLRIRFSPRLAAVLSVLHALAAVALWLADLPPVLPLAGTLLLGLHLRRIWPRHISRTAPDAVCALALHADGEWSLMRRDGIRERAAPRPPLYVTHGLIVARFPRDRVLVLPADACRTADWRRLHARLRSAVDGDGRDASPAT